MTIETICAEAMSPRACEWTLTNPATSICLVIFIPTFLLIALVTLRKPRS